jgi:hypothetical protein
MEVRRMRVVVGNSFSLNMLGGDAVIACRRITKDEFIERIREAQELVSVIGHQGTADLVSAITGVTVEANRVNYSFLCDDVLLVVVLKGRIGEGVVMSQSEAEKIGVDFWEVRVQ